MTLWSMHDLGKVVKYAAGELSVTEREALEQHMNECTSCRDFQNFVQRFNAGLRAAKSKFVRPETPCPDAELLVGLDAGELDEETEQRVRTHALFCKDCLEILLALERARPKRMEAVLRVAGGLVECLRISEWAEVTPLVAAAATKGTERGLTAPFRAAQTVTDPDSGEESSVAVRIEEGLKPERVRVIAECDPVREKWEVSLLDSKQQELASKPLAKLRVEVGSGLPYGTYALEIRKANDCLGSFDFAVEPFNLPEAIDVGLERLRNKEYSRALAILGEATARYPANREAWDLLCLAQATAAQDPEGFAEDQKKFGVMRSKTDMEDEITGVLDKREAHVEENFASFLARFAANPSLLGGQAVQTLETYKPSLAILQAMALFAGQLQDNSERIQQLQQTSTKQLAELTATREQLKQVLNQLESVTIRLDQFTDILLDLQSSIEGVRNRTDQDTDKKLDAVRDILERFERDRTNAGLSFSDYEPLFVETLGKSCWSWLGPEVRTIFVSAEGLFRYHGSQPAIYVQDHSPALFQFCRGLELLLNINLYESCVGILDSAMSSQELQDVVRIHFPTVIEKELWPKKGTFSVTQVVNLLHMGEVIQRERGSVFGGTLEQLLSSSSGLTEVVFLEPLFQIGVSYRNGVSHPTPGSPSLFTSQERIWELRKLIFGLDEEHINPQRILQLVRKSPWLSERERQDANEQLATQWRTYSGLVKILWRAIEPSCQP